jgi:hypothetical protein
MPNFPNRSHVRPLEPRAGPIPWHCEGLRWFVTEQISLDVLGNAWSKSILGEAVETTDFADGTDASYPEVGRAEPVACGEHIQYPCHP